jgi:hypothetical protein
VRFAAEATAGHAKITAAAINRTACRIDHLPSRPSCLAESTVNAIISKRFAKRQQMQWTKRGAHLLRQTRTRTLDGTLRPLFEEWYPGLANDNSADST